MEYRRIPCNIGALLLVLRVAVQQIDQGDDAPGAELTALQLDHIFPKHIFGIIGYIARRAKIALGRIIGSLAEVITLHRLGDEEMQVGIALAMGMRYHVYRDTINGNIDIGAMIGVETAEEDLLCFAAALVLRNE